MPAKGDRLDRDRVLKTAIDLLDQVGLAGLSLRRLATELGVQAPALYWHFANKQALLDQLVEMIMDTEVPAAPLAAGETWDDWLAERARQMRRMLNRHRDGAMLAASTHPQPSQLPQVEMHLLVLVNAGFTPGAGLRAMLAINNYVSGFTLEEQADRDRGRVGEPADAIEWEQAMAEFAPYPTMAAALREIGDPQSDAAFEAGLALLLDGLRQYLARQA